MIMTEKGVLKQIIFSKELWIDVNDFFIHFTSTPCQVHVLSISLHIDYLCSIRSNLIQSSNSAIEKANYFIEIVISNTPWPIHQEC